ncbi:IS110 family transposase [Bacteroides uniformis]|nr:IS110 family transposase [Bacteroides uniformis]MCO7113468.1 IS110 family transposase [Bacteroides uniformis]MCO7114607.1 IS110 family transposase [Bacteroides uniformis]
MSELGHDFTRKFPSSKQFCCWCNISPNTKISGRKKNIKPRATPSEQCRVDF